MAADSCGQVRGRIFSQDFFPGDRGPSATQNILSAESRGKPRKVVERRGPAFAEATSRQEGLETEVEPRKAEMFFSSNRFELVIIGSNYLGSPLFWENFLAFPSLAQPFLRLAPGSCVARFSPPPPGAVLAVPPCQTNVFKGFCIFEPCRGMYLARFKTLVLTNVYTGWHGGTA